MSEQIEIVLTEYSKTFLGRREELKAFLNRYFEHFFETYNLEQVDRVENSPRIQLAGYHEDLSGWRVREIITVCVHEQPSTRHDYQFIFDYKEPERPVERVEDEGEGEKEEEDAKDVKKLFEKKAWKDFSEEEKEEYKRQKEQEKQEVEDTFDDFLKAQTAKEVVETIDKTLSMQLPSPVEKAEEEEEIDEDKKERIEKVKEELKQVHGYSIRNYLLVLSQAKKRKDDKFVGVINSYWNWKRQGAQVLRNPDKSKPYSYKILVPVMKKGALQGFKLGSVFDISQTNKYEDFMQQREDLEAEISLRDEIEYETAVDFVQEHFPDLNIEDGGEYVDALVNYNPEDASIAITYNTSHELFHGLGYHIIQQLEMHEEEGEKMRDRNEMLAELACYLLMKTYETDPKFKINYDFGYSSCWALEILDVFKFGEFEKAYNTLMEYIKSL